MTKISDLQGLTISETKNYLLSVPCHCQFCGVKIQWARAKRWIEQDSVLAYQFPFKDFNSSPHICSSRPRSWTTQGIPEGWEYERSDDDDDTAYFIAKKYTEFRQSQR